MQMSPTMIFFCIISFIVLLVGTLYMLGRVEDNLEKASGFIVGWEEKDEEKICFKTAFSFFSCDLDRCFYAYSIECGDPIKTRFGEGIRVIFWEKRRFFYSKHGEFLFEKKAFFDFEEKEVLRHLPVDAYISE
jgi:hypothetical protein